MPTQMHAKHVAQLRRAIVFMNMHNLKEACDSCGIPSSGRKRELIARILACVQGSQYTVGSKAPKLKKRREEQEYRLDALMHPETYTNGATSRAFLTKQIGSHFRFTVFGMDWIQQRWTAGHVPTFMEFVEFWQQEYQRRKNTGDFKSKPELARVNLFRKLGQKTNISRVEMEQSWKEEQASNTLKAQRILSQWLKT
jgi:hypothetical protein